MLPLCRIISRWDLINWRVQLEYDTTPKVKEVQLIMDCLETTCFVKSDILLRTVCFTMPNALLICSQMSKTKVGFMDMKEFKPVLPPEFFIDLLAGDQSIVKKVFGQYLSLCLPLCDITLKLLFGAFTLLLCVFSLILNESWLE